MTARRQRDATQETVSLDYYLRFTSKIMKRALSQLIHSDPHLKVARSQLTWSDPLAGGSSLLADVSEIV